MNINVATAWIENNKGELLILKRSKSSKLYSGYWQLPEGKLKSNESGKLALTREIEEELGYKPSKLNYIGKFIYRKKVLGLPLFTFIRMLYRINKPLKIELSYEHSDFKWQIPELILEEKKLLSGTRELLLKMEEKQYTE